ncbi:sialate O-acetylesterase [Lysobacter sp. cf310]|uniref:sialate O-acetylesterase n=1 Tax=Lysobacter sp. cf310 TaxID=1761790 RepID=UPI0008EFF3B9|nr:sialate O-acetylesterase [Lysobacter sp. cf310]SFK69047.1 protein of unknown function [Lysobacter sp. cf310]
MSHSSSRQRARRGAGLMLALCVFGGSSSAQAQQAPMPTLRTYIVAGQSNAEGTGVRRNNPANGLNPQQDLYTIGFGHWDSDYTQALIYKGHPDSGVGPGWDAMRPAYGSGYEHSLYRNNMFGPELAIGREVAAHLKEPIAIIKYSKGGTLLAVDWDPTDPGINRYDYLINTINHATQAMAAGGIALDIQGVFWMQGESDSGDIKYAQHYQANLERLIATLRTQLNKPTLDFYVATIRDTPVWTYRQHIWNAQQAVADADPNVYLVNGRDLEAYNNDPMHYTARGQVTLGQRFALQALYDAWGLGQF